MQYEGKITYIGDVETVGQNNLQKRTVVLEEYTDREFKWGIAFDLIKDKVDLIDQFKVGDFVKVSLNSRTNYSENTQRYYNSITAWRIDALQVTASSSAAPASAQEDDLPF
jgi:hypothetical protein